jgi:acyl-CoA reductase-like NAD-dependent aldehyde dehydrogenase
MLRRSLVNNKFQTKLFLGGEFIESSSSFETLNPATGKVIASVSEATSRDVDRAVSIAHSFFQNEQAQLQDHEIRSNRKHLLLHLANSLEKDFEYMSKLETLNCGKPIAESKFDVDCSIKCLRYYASLLQQQPKFEERNLLAKSESSAFSAFKRRQPLGVAALITPFNYPLLISTWKIAPALASGCAVVHKPAEQTPLTALRFAEYFLDFISLKKLDQIEGMFQVLPGRGEVTGAALVDYDLVSKVSFTGSNSTGQHILARCATSKRTLKRVCLELGGKSPLVIHKDATLDSAVEAILANAFGNQGQICTAASRVLCHENIHDELVSRLTKRVKEHIVMGDCSEEGSECTFGPVISQKQKDKILEFIQSGIDEGAKLVDFGEKNFFDGKIKEKESGGFFVPPTIFVGVRDDMRIAKEEIFGPVLSILNPYSDGDVASGRLFDRCNDTDYGLAAGIFTHDKNLTELFCQRVLAGTIWVNESFGYCFDQVPFGGFKKSGLGRELGGQDGIDSYCETKAVIFGK